MEQIQQSPNLRTLKNGAIYDTSIGRIVSSKNATTKITKANSADYLSRRLERKRERIEAGARAAVDAAMPGTWTGEGDDWIEAVAQAVTEKALDPTNAKQVDAARFLLTETGLAERQAQPQTSGLSGLLDEAQSVAVLVLMSSDIMTIMPSDTDANIVDAQYTDEQAEAEADEAGGEG